MISENGKKYGESRIFCVFKKKHIVKYEDIRIASHHQKKQF